MMTSVGKWTSAILVAGTLCFGTLTASATTNDSATADKKFVAASGKGSLAEIQMAKLALANSSSPDVKDFAAKMIQDHQGLIESMKPFAKQMGVPPPAKMERAEQDEYDRLAKKKGDSFDKDYVQTMVDDHHKDLADFNTEINNTQNPALKETVTKGAQVIKGHTEMIDGIAHKYNLNVPTTPGGL